MKYTTEWQYRMPEDRGSDDGWITNTPAGAKFLHEECGAELRSRNVTAWVKEVA